MQQKTQQKNRGNDDNIDMKHAISSKQAKTMFGRWIGDFFLATKHRIKTGIHPRFYIYMEDKKLV